MVMNRCGHKCTTSRLRTLKQVIQIQEPFRTGDLAHHTHEHALHTSAFQLPPLLDSQHRWDTNGQARVRRAS